MIRGSFLRIPRLSFLFMRQKNTLLQLSRLEVTVNPFCKPHVILKLCASYYFFLAFRRNHTGSKYPAPLAIPLGPGSHHSHHHHHQRPPPGPPPPGAPGAPGGPAVIGTPGPQPRFTPGAHRAAFIPAAMAPGNLFFIYVKSWHITFYFFSPQR